MASSSNFDLTYNKLDVVAGGALSNATSTPVSGGTGSGVTQIVAGTNVTISPSGGTGVVTVNSTAGGGGTVTSVASGTGLTGGPITTSGTLSIASTGVSAASYGTASSVPTIAVNAQGQITSASNTSIAISGGAVSGNIAGNAANVTGTVAIGNGGTGATTAATARTNLGLGTVATQTAPSGTSSQLLANNGSGGFNNVTVGTGLSYSGGTLTSSSSGGTVTSVGTAGSVNGITLTGGPITTSGTVTLGGTLGSIANSQLSNSAITINTSTGLSGGGTVSLGGSLTLTNTVSGLPSGGSTSQVILKNASSTAWYTEHFDVKAFGATGDGSTDDHLAVNNAIAALNAAGGGVLYFPYGTYKMTAAITNITVPCRVIGDGINASTINQTSTSDALVISTSQQCIVQDITLQCTSSYNALTITAPSGSFNSRSMVNNVNVGGTPAIGFNFNEAFAVVTNCTVTGTIGIKMQNLVNPDESAGMITQCQINTNGGTAIALYADGVQVIDNYFYDNNYAVEIFVNNTTGTLADFWITNNHIEYCLISAVRFNNTSSGSYLINVLVSNNEIAWSPPPSVTTPATCNGVDQTGTLTSLQWLQDFTISDNVFSTNVNNVYLTHASFGTVVGNSMNICNYGIYLGSDTSNILAKDNLISNATTAAAIDNGSSNLVGNDVGYTSVPTLTGGTATESHTLYVSPSVLGKKPDGVNVQVTSDPTVGCYYNWDDTSNSSTQVAIVFFKYSGGNLSSGDIRITARVGP